MKFFRHRSLWLQVLLTCIPCIAISQQLEGIGQQKPFSFHGNFSTNLIGYGISGMESRMHPFSLMLSSNATANVYGIAIPFTLRYSNRRVDYTQPFNQFGMSPTYKWATLHVGYRSVNFSNFTMAGHNFLGGGLELNPGKLRMGFVYGRFKKSTTAFAQAIDTTQTLTRKGFGLRLGWGSQHTFADLILLKIHDDSTSVADPFQKSYLPAEENTVAGIQSRIKLSKSLSFDTELAASVYTTDVSAPRFADSDDYPILNQIQKLITVNQSTELLTAVRAGLNYRLAGFSTRLEYRRIDPGYRSMGAYFMNNDIENITIAPSVSLLKRKLNLRGSLGVQRDNLRNVKRATSLRTISSFQASYNPSAVFGIDFSYSNYSSNQRAGRVPLIDSLKLFQTNSNINITPRLLFTRTQYNHIFIVVLSRMELRDRNVLTQQFTDYQATLINLNYNLGLLQHRASILTGVNYNLLEHAIASQKALGFTLGAAKSLMEGKASLGLNNSLIRTQQGQNTGWTVNSSLSSSYQISRKQAMRFNLYYIRSLNYQQAPPSHFNEIKGDLSYVYTF